LRIAVKHLLMMMDMLKVMVRESMPGASGTFPGVAGFSAILGGIPLKLGPPVPITSDMPSNISGHLSTRLHHDEIAELKADAKRQNITWSKWIATAVRKQLEEVRKKA
jgi:hypothetical protein